jgi:hypothetical protein
VTLSLEDYQKLKARVDHLAKQLDRVKWEGENAVKTLKGEFGAGDLDEALTKLQEMEEVGKVLEEKAAKAQQAFEEAWREKLESLE